MIDSFEEDDTNARGRVWEKKRRRNIDRHTWIAVDVRRRQQWWMWLLLHVQGKSMLCGEPALLAKRNERQQCRKRRQ
jgi:hypothetical protein